jgi:hypothetical protein
MPLISELPAHKAILQAIENNDCNQLLRHLGSLSDLQAIDSKGESLLTKIKKSSIDINQKALVQCDLGAFNLSPLTTLFFMQLISSDTTIPPIERLRILLALGANVNEEVFSKGNTFLHEYLARPNAHPVILRELFFAKSDFFKKNDEGKTPLDVANKQTAIFINRLFTAQTSEKKSAIKIQRQWRLHSQKKLLLSKPSVSLIHPLLNREAKAPAPNPPNIEKIQQWVNKHDDKDKETAQKVIRSVQYIPHAHFLFGLKMAIKKFNRYLLSLPEPNRNYVLMLDDREDKSCWWVTKLAERYLAIPPSKIVTFSEMSQFKPNENWCPIVYLDDASYSGNFLHSLLRFYERELRRNPQLLMNTEFHLIIPFVTEKTSLRIKFYDDLHITLHTQEEMPKFNIPGTLFRSGFSAETATYFDHKIPDSEYSTIEYVTDGILVNGKESGVRFVEPVTPPYKKYQAKA